MFKREQSNSKIFKGFNANEVTDAQKELSKIITKSREYAFTTNKGDSDDLYEMIFRKELASSIVDTLIKDIDYDEKREKLCFKRLGALALGLKKLLFYAIKADSEKILSYEKVGEKVITGLYEIFTDKSFNNKNELLSTTYRLFDNPVEQKRRIIDYISGMMDQYAIGQYEKFFGKNPFLGIYDGFPSKRNGILIKIY